MLLYAPDAPGGGPPLLVNGVDPTALGPHLPAARAFTCWVVAPPAVLDGIATTPRTREGGEAVGALGDVPAGLGLRAGARALTCTLGVAVETPERLEAALDSLKALVPPGPRLTLRTADDPAREFLVRRTACRVTRAAPAYWATEAEVTFEFSALTPAARSRTPRVVGLDTTPTAVPLGGPAGTLPVWPRVRIYAGATGATNPAVVVTDLAGAEVARLGAIIGLAAGEWLEIDGAARTLTQVSPLGVRTGVLYLRDPATDFFALDPRDGDPLFGIGPALAVRCTVGSVTGEVRWRPLWD